MSIDYFRDPELTNILTQLAEPVSCCQELNRCTAFGNTTPVCDIRSEFHNEFVHWTQKLFRLSDVADWYWLREALHALQDANALKACTLQAIFVVARSEVTNEDFLQQALAYDPLRERAHDKVKKSTKLIADVIEQIPIQDRKQPERQAVRKFTAYKQALTELVSDALSALDEVYSLEESVVSGKVTRLVDRVSSRQLKIDLLDPASRQHGEQMWDALATLIQAGKALLKEPDPDKAVIEYRSGTALRLETSKLSAEEVEALKRWFDHQVPGLYDRIENDPDQVGIIEEILSKEKPFSSLANYVIQTSLQYREDGIAEQIRRNQGSKTSSQSRADK